MIQWRGLERWGIGWTNELPKERCEREAGMHVIGWLKECPKERYLRAGDSFVMG
jgi:hypothetical protein